MQLFCSQTFNGFPCTTVKSKVFTTGYMALHDSAPDNPLTSLPTTLATLVPWLFL